MDDLTLLYSDLIFDFVISTTPEKFLEWISAEWETSIQHHLSFESREYDIEWEILKPNPDTELHTYEVDINSKDVPSLDLDGYELPSSLDLSTNQQKREYLLGFLTVQELLLNKI